MSARVVDLTNAMVAAINGGTFSESFTAAKNYLPTYAIAEADLDDTNVVLTPRASTSDPNSRSTTERTYTVDVAVVSRADGDSETEALLGLVDEIDDFLTNLNLGDFEWLRNETESIYVEDQLKNNKVFISVISATYYFG